MSSKTQNAGEVSKPKKKIQRLRTGCWTCRRRGYKCDEGKPHCKNCTRLNIVCEGYGIRLKWQEDRLSPRRSKKASTNNSAAATATTTTNHSSNSNSASALSSSSSLTNQQLPHKAQTSNSRLSSPIYFESYRPNNPGVSAVQHQLHHYPSHHQTSMSEVNTPVSGDSALSNDSPLQILDFVSPSISPPKYQNLQFDNTFLYAPPQQWANGPPQPNSPPLTSGHQSTASSSNESLTSNAITQPAMAEAAHMTIANNNSAPLPLPLPSPAMVPFSSNLQMAIHGGTERLLINHFYNVLAEELNVLDGYSAVNIFRDVILPLHENSASLRFALCGLASRHMSQLYPEYISMSVEFKVEALKSLREGITQSLDLPALSSILILAMQEVYESNYDIWQKHVRGAVRGATYGTTEHPSIMQLSASDTNLRLISYLLEYHDTTSSLISDTPPMLSGLYRATWYLDSGTCSDAAQYSFVASLGPLFRAASGMASLAHEIHKYVHPSYLNASNFVANMPAAYVVPESSVWSTKQTERRLEFQILLSMWAPLDGMQADMYHTTQLIKTACDLYFYMRLDSTEFGVELSPNIKALVVSGLRALEHVSLSSGSNVIHAWPLWQIGIACEQPADQQIVLSRLEQLKWKTNKISLQSIIDFLRLLWYLRRDANYSAYTCRELLAVTTTRSLPVILF